jgi:hypothetical protein
MQVMVVHKTPTLTRERYEAVVRGLTGGKSRLDSPDDVPTGGLLVHVAGETDDGFVIFDVFESQAAFGRFGEFVAPIARAAGIEEPPKELPPAHIHLGLAAASGAQHRHLLDSSHAHPNVAAISSPLRG